MINDRNHKTVVNFVRNGSSQQSVDRKTPSNIEKLMTRQYAQDQNTAEILQKIVETDESFLNICGKTTVFFGTVRHAI